MDGTSGVLSARRRSRGGLRLAAHPAAARVRAAGGARRRPAGPGLGGAPGPRRAVGAVPRDRARVPHGRAGRVHVPDRAGSRRAGPGLLRPLLPGARAAQRGVRRAAAGVRRRDVRARHHGRPDGALHLLGDHVRPVLPADRLLGPPHLRPPLRHHRPDRHHVRRPGHARGPDHAGPLRRVLADLRRAGRGPRPPRGRRRARPVRGRRRPRADRRADQVRPGAVPLLAAGRDGRPDPGLGLPARGRDGEGRRLPRGPPGPRLPRAGHVAGARARPGPVDPPAGRLAGPAADRRQARARLRHGLPARLPHGGQRAGRPRRGAGRPRDAPGARPVQGPAVHGGRHHRPRGRHP